MTNLLREYGLLPEVFAADSFSSEEVQRIVFGRLNEEIGSCAIIRNFRGGDWESVVKTSIGRAPLVVRETFLSWCSNNRLIKCKPERDIAPANMAEWLDEVVRSDRCRKLCGIIVGDKTDTQAKPRVAKASQLDGADWWTGREYGARIERRTDAYLENFDLLFRHANSFIFCDPYLNPQKRQYSQFYRLLKTIALVNRNGSRATVRIHCGVDRVYDHFQGRMVVKPMSRSEWQARFEPLACHLRQVGMVVDVFVWDGQKLKDGFHDRHLLTNIAGLELTNGFDEGRGTMSVSVLGKRAKDVVSRNFEENVQRPVEHFRIGASK